MFEKYTLTWWEKKVDAIKKERKKINLPLHECLLDSLENYTCTITI